MAMQDRSSGVSKRLICTFAIVLATPLFGCLEDDVRYGPVGGLRVRGSEGGGVGAPCSLPEGTDTMICPSWEQTIFPLFDVTYGCTDETCHGSANGAANLTMPPGDPAANYDALALYKRGTRPYIGTPDAYLICNIWAASPEKVGTIMPIIGGDIVPFTLADLQTVASWAACNYPEIGGVVPQGGMGGVGGAGGGI